MNSHCRLSVIEMVYELSCRLCVIEIVYDLSCRLSVIEIVYELSFRLSVIEIVCELSCRLSVIEIVYELSCRLCVIEIVYDLSCRLSVIEIMYELFYPGCVNAHLSNINNVTLRNIIHDGKYFCLMVHCTKIYTNIQNNNGIPLSYNYSNPQFSIKLRYYI